MPDFAPFLRLLSLLSLLSPLAGCALPIAGGFDSDAGDLVDEPRVFMAGDVFVDAADRDFSFVVRADVPHVVLATLSGADGFSTGEPTFAREPWLDPDLVIRRDVDIQMIPVELLVRQGEPFVASDGLGGTCIGYLGELSVVRLVSRYNLADRIDGLTDEEQRFTWAPGVTTPPTERLGDAAYLWDTAERTYLVARWESDDGCIAHSWGYHPEHAPIAFREIPADPVFAEAHELFRSHPEYTAMQRAHDDMLEELAASASGHEYEYGEHEWGPGPWENGYFGVRAFVAADGSRLAIASADQANGCSGGPSALHLLFEVGLDGSLALKQQFSGVPRYDYGSLVERNGALHFLSDAALITLDELYEVESIAPYDYGCGC